MRKARMFALVCAVCCLAFGPALAAAQAAEIGQEAKSACVSAGGVLLDELRETCVLSPYGTQSVVLRSAPSNSYDAVAMLMVGQKVTAAGTMDTFYFVVTEDGVFGWLAEDEIEAIESI